MSGQQRRKYDPEFKRNAVLLTEEPGRSVREESLFYQKRCERSTEKTHSGALCRAQRNGR
jgi:hypothetical protein